jgi:mono/diheme cytochrome c family protein
MRDGDERRTLRNRAAAWLFLPCVLGPFLAGCHSAPRLTPHEAEGKRLYEGRCAHCHQDNDLNLKKVPPDLHNLFKRSTMPSGAPATDPEVRRVVLAGKGLMPAFAGRFTEEQLAALIAYLRTGLQ